MAEPIRVLHVVTYMGRGGLESMLMNYYRNIDRTKVQFDFLVHRQERHEYEDEIESLGGRIYRVSRLKPWSSHYRREVLEFFRSHPEYKIVHCHVDCMSAIPLQAAKKAGVPVRIAHSHSSNQHVDLKYLLKLYYKKQIPSAATDLFSCGEIAGKWMFGNHPFRILPNAIDAKAFSYNPQVRERMRREMGWKDELIIGHVGNFSEVKNHPFILDVLKELLDMGKNVKLFSVGEGYMFDSVLSKARKLQLEDAIFFAGNRGDVADCLQAMDVFILPSLHEGLPVTTIEAQAAGLPCLISDKVPIECKKTDLVKQIPLDRGPRFWAEEILKARGTPRRNTAAEIADSGFDICGTAVKLQNFYTELYQTRG